jgi:hypothetical protein
MAVRNLLFISSDIVPCIIFVFNPSMSMLPVGSDAAHPAA